MYYIMYIRNVTYQFQIVVNIPLWFKIINKLFRPPLEFDDIWIPKKYTIVNCFFFFFKFQMIFKIQ